VLAHYSDGTMRCGCCGEDKLPFLALDHIAGGGAKQRQELGRGVNFWRWIIRSGFPPGIQVLCHNCNLCKSAYGSCAHTRKRAVADSSTDSRQA
jgi:hypothetical protein